MTYYIYEIELNGETNISRFNNKKEVRQYLNSNFYIIVDRIERETKKCVTDVTDQFEIQHLVDSTEQEDIVDIQADIVTGDAEGTLSIVGSLYMYIDDFKKLNPLPQFVNELIEKDIAWCKSEILKETKTKKRLKREVDLGYKFFDEQYRITCKYIEKMSNTLSILKRLKRLAKGVTK